MNDHDMALVLRVALLLVLDSVDYEAGACRVNEQVGAALPPEVLAAAKHAVHLTRELVP